MDKPQRNALGVFGILAVVITLICCVVPRIAQPAWYHHFADQRNLLGIPNFGDVVSNLPFAVFGLWGIAWMLRALGGIGPVRFIDRREVWPYLAVFCGLLLTAFGSAYYHLAPDNARLVWDRMPMTIAFMSLVAAVIAERVDVTLGLRLLPVLLAIGFASVLQWYWSEVNGVGDLRFYAAVQVYAVLVILFALFLPGPYTRGADFGVVFGLYAVAKVLELCDGQIFNAFGFVSGHTLKHLVAATAGYWILRMLVKRRPLDESTFAESRRACSSS